VSTEIIDGREFLKIEVADTGIGIRDQDKNKLFKMFGFLQSSAHINTNGIGLGLVISKQLVERFEGKIWLESEVNVGTTFTFTIHLPSVPYSPSQLYLQDQGEVLCNSDNLVFRWSPAGLQF